MDDMEGASLFVRILDFLEVDADTRARAHRVGRLLEPHFDGVADYIYDKVMAAEISPHVTLETVERLKQRQKQHWRALFETTFDRRYREGVERIGIAHRDIDLDPAWYIAGYTLMKMEFSNIIVRLDLPIAEKGHLIRTLDKYLAIDMGLSLSAFHATALVD